MDETIIMSIDCYDCGNKIEFDYRIFNGAAAYSYCNYCGRGIQVYYNSNILSVDLLSGE